ncbi:MAG: N-6 DNA methylase [Betaproteobacteria bacterium]|nr:N-6 DNA methylase [Betaproteobacteria bacterium]MDE2124586.1 N-6 DNA methylase [Betaproteobacteria bacterium]MDE2187415.1 N-6 DNA methylase [Betaproteobacteria bacterium]MDE2323334.1 N-6 DNA methylase [Betaproteobacteria bacterium]
MLDTATKRRIDTARDILVGKVPDPKSQVEQITIALIYKFMDDMDADSEEMGGQRKFFTGAYARYGWARLMRSGLGGHETLNLYAEGIARMPENAGIPPLFRDIFKNVYLPYRDPETLRAFLKIIDEFSYDHSERLGDAFEYLLSVLGSQGDAGQFRTPRHIIDFMVDVLDPKKTDTVLDPACGTAGFLIASWKHILKANSSPSPQRGEGRGEGAAQAAGDLLSPDEKARLARNVKGYDISPDMVRLSLVNLYLHGFTDPHIVEYDTLTSDERWHEHADVILANPPFMSPKGGIKPHRRFSIQAKRSEVLFVDYMAEHLTPQGRAAIIVPEGIIFQSQTAYKALRKLLVEQYLVAVVSLPAGVFQPYSGVKTSILILDRSLARPSGSIAFFKVDNDGYGLGAQRRAIENNDLPQVKVELGDYLQALRSQQVTADLPLTCGLVVPKEKIAANGDYNLSGERYREGGASSGLTWPLVPIGDLCVIERGASPRPIHDFITNAPDGVNWIKIGDAEVGAKFITATKERVTPEGAAKSRRVKPGDFILSNSMSFGRPYIMATDGCIHDGWLLLREHSVLLDQDFLYNVLGSKRVFAQFEQAATGGVVNNLNSEIVRRVQIPLPPLEVQKEIVAEIEGYQKVIDGARAVLDHYRTHIPIHPDWPMVPLAEVCESISDGDHQPPPKAPQGIPFVTITNITDDHELDFTKTFFVPEIYYASLSPNRKPRAGDVLYTVTGSYGIPVLVPENTKFCFQRHIALIRTGPRLLNRFLFSLLASPFMLQQGHEAATGVAQKTVSLNSLRSFNIPLPPLATQQAIVAEIEAEQALVAANRELIARFEQKIQATLARVWGENAAETLGEAA